MSGSPKIALYEPGREAEGRYFTLQLKKNLNNEAAVFNPQGRTIVIAPVNISFHSFQRFLLHAGIIDKKRKWNFGNGHLVILGDCFSVPECLWLIYGLEEKALKNGGYIHYILGEQEISNMNGQWQYQHPSYAITPESHKSSHAVLYDGNKELKRWFCTKNIVEKIGATLVSHIGISSEINSLKLPLGSINQNLRNSYAQSLISCQDSLLNTLLNEIRVVKESVTKKNRSESDEKKINRSFQLFHVNTIIAAMPDSQQVNSYYNGKLINVYTDFSEKKQEFIVIDHGHYYRFDTAGRKEMIK